jgi:hypothetical protein
VGPEGPRLRPKTNALVMDLLITPAPFDNPRGEARPHKSQHARRDSCDALKQQNSLALPVLRSPDPSNDREPRSTVRGPKDADALGRGCRLVPTSTAGCALAARS